MREICNQVNLRIDKYDISDLRGGSVRFYLKEAADIKIDEYHHMERFSTKEEIQGLEALVQASKFHLKNILINFLS